MARFSNSRDIYRVVAARFLSRTGSEAAFFVGVWGKAAFKFDATAVELAIIMFLLSVGTIAGSFLAGVLVDRFGPKRVLIVAEFFFIPAAIALAFTQNLTQLAVLVGIWGFLGAPVVTSAASMAPYLVTKEDTLQRINSWIEGAAALAFVCGPAIGALLVGVVDVGWIFVFDAATSLAAALIVIGVHLQKPAPAATEGEKRHAFSEMAEGLRVVARSRSLRYYILAGMVVWLAFGSFGALEPLFFRDVVGTNLQAMSWMNAIFGVGFVVGAALLPRLPRGVIAARGVMVLVALIGLGTVLYVGSTDLRVIAAGALFWSLFIGVLEPLLRTLLQRDAPPGMVGRVIGTEEVATRVAELVPLAFAPALAAAFGVQAVLIGGGLFATTAALLSYWEARRIDRENALKPPRDVEIAGVRAADEPISPTP